MKYTEKKKKNTEFVFSLSLSLSSQIYQLEWKKEYLHVELLNSSVI